ncbi:thrombospondin type-1 domain-containing protein 4 isoform X2 [Phlebotomus argentipes]|nr:thrombospondin type-1 domain-containing protein 4 isoform X2 [Phlebotomus argentipes]
MTVISVSSGDHLSPRERLQMHKAWLERRAAQKAQMQDQEKSSYFRKVIKFKTDQEPIHSNDISFMPKQDFDPPSLYDESERNKYDVFEAETNITTTTLSSTTDTSDESSSEAPNGVQLRNNVRNMDVSRRGDAAEVTATEMARTTTPMPRRSKPKEPQKPRKGSSGNGYRYWSPWSNWTECSRSCGGGIKMQARECIAKVFVNSNNNRQGRNKSNAVIYRNNTECIGLYKRYNICNEQECPDSERDFRGQQCAQFNNQTFRGKRYVWEAFIKEDAECELNCKPVGLNYFATLNNAVIDGTPCTKPAEYYRRNFQGRAVCVEGICKMVHNSGIIVGAYMNNGAVRCGNLICRPISEIFTKNPLPTGYVHIATIPSGASNISVTEQKNSINLLVLRNENQSTIINGDYTVSSSGIYEAAGTTFDYRRIDNAINGVTEWITSLGPTAEPIQLMVLAQQPNPGIKYEYLLPINALTQSGSEEEITESVSAETESPSKASTLKSGDETESQPKTHRRRRFQWKVLRFQPCTKTCGGGVQLPVIKCVRDGSVKISPLKKCAHLPKPTLSHQETRCNIQPCPAYWKISPWEECQCGAAVGDEPFQMREVHCVQELVNDRVIQVNNDACIDQQPSTSRSCECSKLMKPPQMEVHKNHLAPLYYQHGSENATTPRHTRMQHQHSGRRPSSRRAGIWLVSEWTESCSVECGVGIQYRQIFCDRSPPNTDRCDLKITPDNVQQCTSEKRCNFGDWFAGQWSECSGDCFNLTRSRQVLCIRDEAIIPDDNCDESLKPETWQTCSLSEVKECGPRWLYSEWTECTKACGEGSQKRVVKCFEPNIHLKLMKESQNCLYSEKPVAFRRCNGHQCDGTATTEQYSEPRVDLVQNDIVQECKDEYPNCHFLIRQTRLCSHSYYSTHCCHTCRKIEEHYHN